MIIIDGFIVVIIQIPYNFLNHYKERYKVTVIFVNDINAAVNGYYHNKLKNNKIESVVGIVFDRVHLPCAGIVIKGEIYTEKSNFAGEVAYMPIGIDWLKLNYHDNEQVCKSIGKLISIISCVLVPRSFVVYGDFSEEDYELGMIKIALEALKTIEGIFVNK